MCHLRRDERGTATAELAVTLPALVLLTALCLWAVVAAAAHLRCLAAAQGAARELARGESPRAVLDVARARAPDGARVELRRAADGLVSVEVSLAVPWPGGWSGGPAVRVGGEAVAASEDGGPAP